MYVLHYVLQYLKACPPVLVANWWKKLEAGMLVNPITGVLYAYRHRKDTGLMVKKFICIQNQENYLVLVKQCKSNKNLDRGF